MLTFNTVGLLISTTKHLREFDFYVVNKKTHFEMQRIGYTYHSMTVPSMFGEKVRNLAFIPFASEVA